MRIPFSRAPVTFESAAPFLKEALDNGWLTTGPLTERFNAGLKKYFGTDNVVPVSSCTAALQIALAASDLKRGDEVIVPANTFIASFETVELAGLTPVLADIDPATWNLSLTALEAKISPWTKAIIAVPFAGNPLPMQALRRIAEKHGLKLILDNAHALESRYDGEPLHHYADFSCYSFYATKNLTTAEGGAIVCSTADMERVRALSLHGMSRAAWNRYSGGSWRYDILETGFKANLTDIHAAIGLTQLHTLDAYHTRRLELMARYRQGLAGLPLRFQALSEGATESDHAGHLFCISVADGAGITREDIMASFSEKSIGFSVHFIPIYEFSGVAAKHGFNPADFPATADYFQGALSLPLYPTLSEAAQDEIIALIRSRFEKIVVTRAE
ncbi:MAG: DegT/DnrJ/EryC1/StrS family aminotransferase [Spirochaetes bacterium]|nr:DegT/DnrJ/EryC1/StrS family aminotransferase [Spirochaetota bacterium]